MRVFIILIIHIALYGAVFSQTDYSEAYIDDNGDTVYLETIPVVTVIEKTHFESIDDRRRYYKLRRDILKVYPYMVLAGEVYTQMQLEMGELDKRRQVKRYKKEHVRALEEEFTEELKNLTTTQGKILVMLINRQTGNNCYKLIKQMKSPIAAFVWQRLAKIWGYNLKEPYIATNNPDMELIIAMIENGQLTP